MLENGFASALGDKRWLFPNVPGLSDFVESSNWQIFLKKCKVLKKKETSFCKQPQVEK